MPSQILPVYVAECAIHDSREVRPERRVLRFQAHSFEPIAGRDEVWADGHCRSVIPAVTTPAYLVRFTEGKRADVTFTSGITVGAFQFPDVKYPVWVSDLLRLARENRRGMSLVVSDGPFVEALPTLAEPRKTEPGRDVTARTSPRKPAPAYSGRTAQASLFGSDEGEDEPALVGGHRPDGTVPGQTSFLKQVGVLS